MPLKINGDTFYKYIYDKFPQIYKTADEYNEYSLHRYLQSLNIGFETLIKDITSLLDALDFEKSPSEFFPDLYNCFGIPYFQDIPEHYQRKLVSIIGELYI